VLLVDLQVGVTGMLGDRQVPANAARVAEAARATRMPVIHVRTAFRPGYPEISPRNKLFGGIKAGGRFADGAPDTAFDELVQPQGGEVIVTKNRIDAFWHTDLDAVLGGLGVDTLVVCGALTSGAVLSAVRSAANRDLRVLVVEDACGDGSAEVHQVLTTRVFPMTAEVVSTGALLGAG